ncbi:penicillin-binding transpeptidase domain-containing protein [Cohnella sp. AR92]|uniref:penicillin-binding transpeptidase domain-containing protein n=1 Tax=Cohnella sp. AR92 TaxID=648716 RepID=UPI000F8EB97A|nr:penicillin-binding transpeptidase domain-containing protein [Cohnella sp. AR92]RUS48439.1 PASTA domain-containing protein [Cohnella sp. AR92]
MTKRIKIRTLLLGGFLTLLFLGLFGRIFWVQIVKGDFWLSQAKQTWITSKPLTQERGTMTDRNGKVLASDAVAYTLAVSPKQINALEEKHPSWRLKDQIVSKLHLVLDKPETEIRAAIDAKKKDGTYLDQREIRPEGWKMDKEVADRLMAFREEMRELTGMSNVGIYFTEEQKRYYPNGSLASQILGYENKDGVAVMGLEKTLDEELRGEAGHITYEKDGIRTQLADGVLDIKQAVDGKNVQLTLDSDIQFYMEQALRQEYLKDRPISVTAIAADPKTMDILGMVSLPEFDPNNYWDYSSNLAAFKNNAIQSVYEPGSTFKIMTLAAAVQEGKFNPNASYQSGSISISKRDKPIHDHNGVGWGPITYLEGLKRSSNVAFVKLGYEMLGKEKFAEYINSFGFGAKTGIELQGEVLGKTTLTWNRDYASATFGQGVTVTPIQQVAAVAAVANGGKLMQPHLVKSITDPKTGEKTVTEPKVIRQVISEETSRLVGQYLEQVVSDREIGTGRNAYIPGYRIAGKTGTAQVASKGGYAADKYVVSFIGYAPVEDPKIVLYVLVDQPDIPLAGGSSVAAPIFKQIMEQSLRHLGVQPKLDDAADKKDSKKGEEDGAPAAVTANVPDVTGMTVAQAKSELANRGFNVEVLGKGGKVLQQLPKANSMIPTSQRIYLATEKNVGSVPNLEGMSLRDSLEMCSLLGAKCLTSGDGYVVAQESGKANGQLVLTLTLAAPGQEDAALQAAAAKRDEKEGDGEEGDSGSDPGSGDAGKDTGGQGSDEPSGAG